MLNLAVVAIEHFKCPSCGARPKQFCRTFKPTMRTEGHDYGVHHVHGPRMAVLKEVWDDGMVYGRTHPEVIVASNKKEKVNV